MTTSQFFVAGPNPAAGYWRGRGVCEVFPDGTYVYHSMWPIRSDSQPTGFGTRSLSNVLATGEWQLLYPSRLLLPAGV